MYIADYHVHPGYSMDAEPYTIEQYCQKALQIGLAEICFTTHFECDPVRRNIDWLVRINDTFLPMEDWSWIDRYFTELAAARAKFINAGLTVKAGVEVGFDLGLEKTIEKLVNSYPWDFILGSVHCLDHIAISSQKESPAYYRGRTPEEVCQEYYSILLEAVKTGCFDCVGHLDIYKRYGVSFMGAELVEIEKKYLANILREIAARRMGIEVNTSGLRKGQGQDFFPAKEIIKLAGNCGVQFYTVGSDAHRISELGMGLELAIEYLHSLGLTIYSYEQRAATPIKY